MRFQTLIVRAAMTLVILLCGPALAASLSIANWNMGNLPNTTADAANASTILGHIGVVAGGPLDLLAMAETDTASAAETAAIARSVFGTANYASVVSAPDGGSDRTGFVYNTSTLSLLSTAELAGGDLTHRILRGHFQPVGGTANSDFYVYGIHLKSGEGSSDRALRYLEARQIRADADALGDVNVLFVGDFNWQGAAERGADPSAYDAFTAAGAGRAFDPLGAVGSWRDNPSFLSLHTNDPGGAMDDRFDMQLVSDELLDGVGLEYVAGSYRVIGNNGTHTLNADIRTGTGAPIEVLDALYAFSDHLPVLASYSFTVPEPAAVVIIVLPLMAACRRGRTPHMS